MNSKNKLKKNHDILKRRFCKNKKSIRITAVSLAVVIALSVFSSNVSSIVNLLTTYAAGGSVYYSADLTLYDYYTDSELKGGGDDNRNNDGINKNRIFNTALYDSGYATKAADDTHTWSGQNLKYFPLYLGLQFPGKVNGNNFMRDNAENKYNYSITANSEANSVTSGAAQGLVDSQLRNGMLTQGSGTVALPYFDEEFLTAPLSKLLSEDSISNLGISNATSKTLGKVQSGYEFKFVKEGNYYVYDSSKHGLNYSENVFTADVNGKKYNDIDSKGAKPGFFPWRYLGNSAQNFGYAAKFSIPFTMSTDGRIVNVDSNGNVTKGNPIEFTFRGDDDVWVFIDDQLVLDVGGAHGAVEGSVNFATKTAVTNKVKTSGMYNQAGFATVGNGSSKDLTSVFNSLGLYDDSTKQHTLTVYYVERGSLESNCYISFNFQIADSISVANKLDTSDVNEFLLDDTKAAAAKEGVEYAIASNSATSALDSPDINKQGEVISVDSRVCTVNFNSGGNYGSYPSYTANVGTQIMLPNGYKLNRSGWRLKGWSLNSSGTGSLYTSYNIPASASSVTFYAVWEKIPMAEVPEPLLMYVSGHGAIGTSSNSGELKNVSGNIYLANLTASGSVNNFWLQINNSQHPNNGSYSFSDNTGEGTKNGNTIKIKAGGAYAFKINNDSSSALYKYTDYNASSFAQITNANAANFVAKHFALYKKLVEARTELLTSENAELQTAYSNALAFYKTVQYSSTAANTLADHVTAIENALNAAQYTHSYSYSANKTKVYIYSESNISGQSVTVTNAGTYGLNSSITSISKFTSVPAGATGSASNYYVAEVPTYIIDTKTPQGGGASITSNIDPEISFDVGGRTVTSTVNAIKAVDANYPCYYADSNIWKGITAPDISYSYSNNKIIWFYGNPGTVTYTSADGEDVKTVTAKKDIEGYYYVEVPQKVTKRSGSTSTTGDVKLSFNLNGAVNTTVTAAVSGRTAPCYFNTGVGTSGWYNLITLGFNTPSFNYIHTWGTGNPLTTEWTSPISTMQQVSGNNYYYYLPYGSGFNVIFRTQSGDSQISTQTLQNFDAMYGSDGDVWHPRLDASGTEYYNLFYEHTATRKATTLLSSYVRTASLDTQSAKVISDDIMKDGEEISEKTETASSDNENADKSDEAVQTEPPEENSESNANLSNDESAVSGLGAGDVGQFINDGTKYAYAKATNFKLYDPYFTQVTGGEQDFLVRQTSTGGKGEFNLMFDQTSRFTYQFKRFNGIKIAQTGTSYKFDNIDTIHKGNTVLAGSQKYSDANSNKALYNRYSTSWIVGDEDGGVITSSRKNYNVHPIATSEVSGANTSIVANSSNNSLYIDNINKAADGNTGIHLTATFTNKVLVGNLTITKTLTDSAKTAIRDYRAEHPGYDPEFAFQISFSNVFGGGSDSVVYHRADSNVGEYYINGTTKSTTYRTVDGVDNCIVMKYSDLYNDDGTSKNYNIVIKGVPVETEFTVKEVIVNADNTPSLQLQSVTQTVLSVNSPLIPDANNTVNSVITSARSQTGVETNPVDLQTGPLSQYYPVLANSTNFNVQFVNDIENAYIILTKKINELYYGKNDNPAGLLGTGATVGGATASADDPNGYEAATDAEQTFIFKISEYNSASASAASKVFYEVINFPKGSDLSKSKLIRVDPTKYYKVEEISDWSWKYVLTGVTVTKDGTNGNGVSSKIATVHNFGETAMFNGTVYSRTDTVTFTNNKKTDNTEDVEGDTSIMINVIGKAS